jgi:hypothetical protein
MRIALVRRILAIVLSVALTIGLVPSAHAGDVEMNSSAAMSSDMPILGGCDRCVPDGKGVAPGLCTAYCSTVIAVMTPSAVFYATPSALVSWPPDLPLASRGEPPDPHPPRPARLS